MENIWLSSVVGTFLHTYKRRVEYEILKKEIRARMRWVKEDTINVIV